MTHKMELSLTWLAVLLNLHEDIFQFILPSESVFWGKQALHWYGQKVAEK